MTVFVTGVNGLLGFDVMRGLIRRGHTVIGSGRSVSYRKRSRNDAVLPFQYVQLDITDNASVKTAIPKTAPDAIIHCAAWTAVDDAEYEENQITVYAVNANGTANIAEAAKICDAKMLYLSTDYVFDGHGTEAWKPDCKDFAPLNIYGKSKLDGEFAVAGMIEKYFIVRISWLFGINGGNFIKTMLKIGKNAGSVSVVDDQVGTPTYAEDLARLLVDMIETDKYGYYHATNSEEHPGEYISWADLAEAIYSIAGYDVRVKHISTEDYGSSKARRPLNSRLDKHKLEEQGFIPLPGWKDALRRYINQLHKEDL